MTTRRTFLTTSSLAALAALRPRAGGPRRAGDLRPGGTPGSLPRATDPELKVWAQRALDAATAAGASYADVRFTITRRRIFSGSDVVPQELEAFAVGVRALAHGSWGFAARTHGTPDLMAQLGRQATELARMTAWPRVPPIELVDHPPAAVGNWVTPVTRDPFAVSLTEFQDWWTHMEKSAQALSAQLVMSLIFERQERTFVSTAGAYTTQTISTALGGIPDDDRYSNVALIKVANVAGFPVPQHGDWLPVSTPTGGGYEVLEKLQFLERLPQWASEAEQLHRKTTKKFDKLGEYDVVFDGVAMASIVEGTFGAALEYDRAVGYEANAKGTSYLAPPLQVLGTARAPAAVTIVGDRTLPLGAATVGWDDEGIAPRPFPLVQDGVVVDYASRREFVGELAPWYTKRGVPVQSNGCAASESAFMAPLVYPPNLVLQPAAQDTSLDALIAGVDDGLLICGGQGGVQMDMQQSSGQGLVPFVYTIKHGKRVEMLKDAAYYFRSPDLWKNLVALGGASTALLQGVPTSKGQPSQMSPHSVKAVAARFRKVRVEPATPS